VESLTPELSVVVPAHDEETALPELIRRTTTALDRTGRTWELLIVDDGSIDRTWPVIAHAASIDVRIRGIRLSRNFGHQAALSAGMDNALGQAVITMDGDLQHPPEAIPGLVDKAAEGYEVVYAVRSEEDTEGRLKVATASVFYRLLNWTTQLNLPRGAADFRYMARPVVDVLIQMPERQRFLRGLTRWAGFAQAEIVYDRGRRLGGRSKYTPLKMLRFAWDAMVSFSAVPLRVASVLGLLVSFVGVLYLIYVVCVRLFSNDAVQGWTSVLAVTLLLGGVQLASLGIIGQYLGRMYDEVKQRPLYVVRGRTEPVERA
jgi:glycosyltransferase involved in cell wall biosynthesis